MKHEPKLSWEEVEVLFKEIKKKVRKKESNDNKREKHLSNIEIPVLSHIEILVLKAAYDKKPYSSIEKYSEDYCKQIGSDLWGMLAEALCVKNNTSKHNINKNNFVQVLESYKKKQDDEKKASLPKATLTLMEEAKNQEPSEVPRAPLDPYFYIERGNVEFLCREKIREPGALIPISSAQGMGKTSLLGKMLGDAQQQGYEVVKLDLNVADRNDLTNSNTFLHWFCVKVSDDLADAFADLNLQSKIEEYWQNPTTPKQNCNKYINYLLLNSECPIVIGIDNIEIIFTISAIYEEFFSLLRSWQDNSKQRDRFGITWRKLRLILVSSTQDYPKLSTNSSPFNVGVSFNLRDFELSEVTDLAKHYGLDEQLGEDGLRQLMGLVGGHPKLVKHALISLNHEQTTLKQLLTFAPTEEGIYKDHFQEIKLILQDDPQLKSAYRDVLRANEPVRIVSKVGFKLASLALVKVSRNGYSSRYDLYRQYFSEHLE